MENKTLIVYIPRMGYSAARTSAAAFKSIGIDARPSPPSNRRTLELASKYLIGDECLPEKITLGNFLKVIEDRDFDLDHTAFLMPTSGGPCRFGQYTNLFQKILRTRGLEKVKILSPTSSNGYEGFGESRTRLIRTMWHAIVVSDALRKLHLQHRPYIYDKDAVNHLFHVCLNDLCDILSERNSSASKKIKKLQNALEKARIKYSELPADYSVPKPLIGVVGEIYCRLNEYSNDYLVNKIESHGGEAWLSDISEWVWYTNDEQRCRLLRERKSISLAAAIARIKYTMQHRDERKLLKPLIKEFEGYEEPGTIKQITNLSHPFLPQEGALGEMVLNVGKSIYLYSKGADGVIDISPFSCMNGIVCEAIYPEVSRKIDNFPIRTFYFDGNQSELDRDLGIFMEIVKHYSRKKKVARGLPHYFK